MTWMTTGYRATLALGHPVPLGHGRRWPRRRWARRRIWLSSGVIGSEFLPHLDEGAIWARGTLAPSTGPTEGTRRDEPGAHASWPPFRR